MKSFLITGGSGFFGTILKERLLKDGHRVVNIDLEPDDKIHTNLVSIVGDIRDQKLLDSIFSAHGPFDGVFHLAAQLAHIAKDKQFLWESNVDGTRNIAEMCRKHGTDQIIFISSNCLWGEPMGRPVLETDTPNPVEIYGKTKVEGEKILTEYSNHIHSVMFRCPTIISAGRLGLLSILYEFMDENRIVWVVGGGKNKYQFIYADDLVNACLKALDVQKTVIYNIGSDNVKSFKEVYEYVITHTNSTSKVRGLPRKLILWVMRLAHKLGLSPLGPYQYKMIAEDFIFDTAKIKKEMDWQPTHTNEDMLLEAYKYYHENKTSIATRQNVSAHKQNAKMGVIKILKWLS